MTARRALISGITGQDGSYLAEYLIDREYEVHGAMRSTTVDLTKSRIAPIVESGQVALHITDVTDGHSLTRLIERVAPQEVYNLAAQSHVAASFDQPAHTGIVTGIGTVNLLESIRQVDPSILFYQAGSSEMFGSTPAPQNEDSPFHPRSPYAVAKVYAYWATINYREAYGMHACNGILFNHESPRRGRNFVTRKITSAIPRLLKGEQHELRLGNLDAQRDWGHARDFVEAMHLILSHSTADDFVVGTGVSRSIRDFLDAAFALVDLDWHKYVVPDPDLLRPAEADHLRADTSKASRLLGWKPSVTFDGLVREMVEFDLGEHGLYL
ncbi:MAG: GDP-mannose 4,6-dehydratase [Acidimicrobiia bacterium]